MIATLKRTSSIPVSHELLIDDGWKERWPAWADREQTEWWLHLPEMAIMEPLSDYLAPALWLSVLANASIYPVTVMDHVAIGPARELTRRQRLGVAWSWWCYRHQTLIWWIRPWIWDWKNWPWHSTADYDREDDD
jgi:hypothetical protein